MREYINRITAYTLLVCLIFALNACTMPTEPISSSSGSLSGTEEVVGPELRVCGAEAFPQRGEDYVYDYENRTNFSYTFIEEDENYIYLEITSGEEYYLPKSTMYLADNDLVRINKTTGERKIIDTRVDTGFTTIKNGKIYYYKITDDNLNAVLTEYDTETGDTRSLNIQGVPIELYISTWEGKDYIEWASQAIGDAGEGKYVYYDYTNECKRVVDTNNGKTYTLPAGGFFCEYNGKYYYGEYDGDYDYTFCRWTSDQKTFRLMMRKIGSGATAEVCKIDFSDETQVHVGYRYVGNGCIFIWNEFFFGRYWIFDIKTGELILKETEDQYDGLMSNKMDSYWTWTYDDEAFYFAECVDEDYNYEVQKVNYDGFNQEAVKGIHLDYLGNIEVCNGYIFVSEMDFFYPYRLYTITRYNLDGSNPVEILYNKYETTENLPPEDDE